MGFPARQEDDGQGCPSYNTSTLFSGAPSARSAREGSLLLALRTRPMVWPPSLVPEGNQP